MSDFVEVIHVELSDEACELIVLEVLWQDSVFKSWDVVDYETMAIFSPVDLIGIFI